MKKLFPLIFLCALALPSPAFGQATRTWVSGTGNDANPCSRTAPCQTFAGAISKTFISGEINVLDSGGFGAVTITKSITIDGSGAHASILAAGTTGVAINIPAGNPNDPHRKVVLRNLSITGTGASGSIGTNTGINGVRIDSAKSVHIENARIANFGQNAIDFTPPAATTNDMTLALDNVVLSENSGNALVAGVTTAANSAQKLNVLVSNSQINGTRGTFGVDGERGIGISADTGAHVWLTGTTIFDNLIGLETFSRFGGAGVIDSYCDNQIGGNADDGVAPNELCPDPPVVTNTTHTETVTQTQAPAPPPVVVEKTVTPPAKCVVPELVGLSLTVAKRGIAAAGCTLGKVTRKRSSKSRVGKVTKQSPKAGSSVAAATKVSLTVGTKPKAKRARARRRA